MSDAALRLVDRAEAVASYKRILRSHIDRRPSGTRQKIALALGKNKSFVSQITNPAYPSPVPAPHLNPIFEICHFSPEERKTFLGAYQLAQQRDVGPRSPRPRGLTTCASACRSSTTRSCKRRSRRPSARPPAGSSRW